MSLKFIDILLFILLVSFMCELLSNLRLSLELAHFLIKIALDTPTIRYDRSLLLSLPTLPKQLPLRIMHHFDKPLLSLQLFVCFYLYFFCPKRNRIY